jgi:hypothetical protein
MGFAASMGCGVAALIAWGYLAARRRRSVGMVVVYAIGGAFLWLLLKGLVAAIIPTGFVLSMLATVRDEDYIFFFESLPAALLSVTVGALTNRPDRSEPPTSNGDKGDVLFHVR